MCSGRVFRLAYSVQISLVGVFSRSDRPPRAEHSQAASIWHRGSCRYLLPGRRIGGRYGTVIAIHSWVGKFRHVA